MYLPVLRCPTGAHLKRSWIYYPFTCTWSIIDIVFRLRPFAISLSKSHIRHTCKYIHVYRLTQVFENTSSEGHYMEKKKQPNMMSRDMRHFSKVLFRAYPNEISYYSFQSVTGREKLALSPGKKID